MGPKKQRKHATLTQGEAKAVKERPPWELKSWGGYGFCPRDSAEAERQ